ncbi:hypothetical protein CWE08_10345 [Aliidiomarina iranensis]|uniref:Uncharacterized protein n=1 Tax=Aliidiomarina iranensis TaxID=1434071 RepID=A0A432VRL2_9GAMM|nr:ankyrin repeat domain-containing protein [Aliidiomarina iranensis]RUO18952.1 hypothetical protein CWE08_10345 [Aliidiomarina iranensis]
MDANQKEASQREDEQPAVSRMSLRRMFPDRQVRALASAAGRGRLERIEQLVAQGVDVNARGTSGATPLYWSFRRKNLSGFKKLLELGADPNVIYEDGTSIMYFVAAEDNLEFLRLALEFGADPNLVSGRRERSIDHPEWAFSGHTPLFHVAIFNPNAIEAVDLLLEYGADINARTRRIGRTGRSVSLLMSSTSGGKYYLTLHLLEHGADYTFVNEVGDSLMTRLTRDWLGYKPDTPLGRKITADMEKVVDWLADRGIEIPESN